MNFEEDPPHGIVPSEELSRGRRKARRRREWTENVQGAKRGRTGANTIEVEWSPALPSGWNKEHDDESNRPYYWHEDDPDNTTWDHPAVHKEDPYRPTDRPIQRRGPVEDRGAEMEALLEPTLEWTAANVEAFLLDIGLVTAADVVMEGHEPDLGMTACRVLVLALCEFGRLSDHEQRKVTNSCKRFLGVGTCMSGEPVDCVGPQRDAFLETPIEQWTLPDAIEFLNDLSLESAVLAANSIHQPSACTINCKTLVLAVLETAERRGGGDVVRQETRRGQSKGKGGRKGGRKGGGKGNGRLARIYEPFVEVVHSDRRRVVQAVRPCVHRWSFREVVRFLDDACLEGAAAAASHQHGIVPCEVLVLAVSGVDQWNNRQRGSAMNTCQVCLESGRDRCMPSDVNRCVDRWSSHDVVAFLDGAGLQNAAAAASQCCANKGGTTSCQALVLAIIELARCSQQERKVVLQASEAFCRY